MYDENGNDWTIMTVITLIVLFTVLGGWEGLLGWYEKIRDKTPYLIRKTFYVIFIIAACYVAIRYV